MDLNQYIRDNRVQIETGLYVRKVECKSGLSMSVQASPIHYCSPREQADAYTEVEIGFPNRVVVELMPYCEDPANPLDTVYAYVPVKIVEKVIDDNGGLA